MSGCLSTSDSKKQHQHEVNSIDNSCYSNLNLNKIGKCSNNTILQSKTYPPKTQFGKSLNLFDDSSSSWKQFSKDYKFDTTKSLNLSSFEKEDTRWKRWQKENEKFSATSNSTLSLHITAYENSIESSSSSITAGTVKDKALNDASKKCGQNFEYPRQQENNIFEPEVMQFKASQQLLNISQQNTVQRDADNDESLLQKTDSNIKDSLSDDDSRGYIELGPSRSQSQISTTDTIYDGPFGSSPVNLKMLAKEFGLNSSNNNKSMPSSIASNSAHRNRYSSLSSNGSFSTSDTNGYPVIAKLNPALIPRSDSSTTLSSITSELPPTNSIRSASIRSSESSRSSSVTSELPPSPKRAIKALFTNLTVIDDPRLSPDYDSNDSVTSQLPQIRRIYPSPSADPRRSATTVGSFSDNVISMGDAKDIYRSIKPEYTFKVGKTDSTTSMDTTQTESDIFPLHEGISPGGTAQQSFEADTSFCTSSSLSSINSEILFPKAKLGLDSDVDDDETHTFSSASQKSQSSISSDSLSSDSSFCLTAKSDTDVGGLKSDISCVSEIFEYALHASPQKLEIESDKCAIFYLENHCSNELFVTLDTPHGIDGIDCSPSDTAIEGHKKKKIVVIARKSMLTGTRNNIRVTYKLKNDTFHLKIPFSIV